MPPRTREGVPSAHAVGGAQLVSWGVTTYSIPPLLPLIASDTGLDATRLGLAMTTGLVLSALGSVAVGAWMSRGGARGPMVAGTLVAASALVAMACAPPGPWVLAPLAILGATGAAVLYEPAFVAVGAASPDPARRARAIQIVTFWGGWAALWSLPAATLLAARWGWRTTLVVLAAALVAGTLPVHARLPQGPSARHAPPSPAPGPGPASVGAPWPFRLTLGFALGGCATGALVVHGIGLLGERGVPAVTASLLFASMAPVQVAGRAWLLRRGVGRREAVAPFVLVAGGLAALLAAPNEIALGTFVLLFGVGAGLATTVRGALAVTRIPEGRLAAELGAMGLVLQLARAAAPTLGAVAHQTLGFHGAVVAALSLAIVGAGLVASCGLSPAPAPPTSPPRNGTQKQPNVWLQAIAGSHSAPPPAW